jgi:CheY-like chemotaxis protein
MPRLSNVPPQRLDAPASPAVPDESLAGVHVLVLDDEPAIRMGMRSLLGHWGCHVTACGGYAEAERVLDEYRLPVDLIVADLRLRQHENGIETVKRLRERLGPVPALVISGDTAPERLREANASGLPLLHKPVASDKLKDQMKALLRA